MQNTIEELLTQIDQKMAKGQRKEPERLLLELIGQMGRERLGEWRQDLLKVISQFQPKRRKNLRDALDTTLSLPAESSHSRATDLQTGSSFQLDPKVVTNFRNALNELANEHIFQWSTYYRDCLAEHFDKLYPAVMTAPSDDDCKALVQLFTDHSERIFSQGYSYIKNTVAEDAAVAKSVSGLARFLEVPLDYYSVRLSRISDYGSAVALRLLFSSAVSGIIEGYSRVSFEDAQGRSVLPRFQRSWVHYMAFLAPQHAMRVLTCVDEDPLRDGIEVSLLPVLDAIHQFFDSAHQGENYFPIPTTAQYSRHQGRLEITMRPPPDSDAQRSVEAVAFLEPSSVSMAALNETLARQARLVVADLRPDTKSLVDESPGLSEVMVDAAEGARGRTALEAYRILDDAIYALRSRRKDKFPITYNFAREFPLRDPQKAKFFHVDRKSVRDLLRTFERRNGVRLWCSVRRSGKTTACFDLPSATGGSVVVSQTCGASLQEGADTQFYRRILAAVDSGRKVRDDFVSDAIKECLPIGTEATRIVLVLDEYETLFGLLRSVDPDSSARYMVVQPILNQLMSFSHDNLLVFLGQQPDAHFILMDQNQLAPYVDQEPFPLFEHVEGSATGEYAELVGKVFSGRIEFTGAFMDALFLEAAGHPFLTVNVLWEFVDWLIEEQRPQVGLRVDEGDFKEFARRKLSLGAISLSLDYDLFREAATSALSEQSFLRSRWLYVAYWIVRLIATEYPRAFRLKRGEFDLLTKQIPVPDGYDLPTSTEILRSTAQANFLSFDDRFVWVKIRVLGRIAASVRPQVT